MSTQLGPATRRLLTKRRYPAEVQSTIDTFETDFDALLADIRSDIADRLDDPGVTDPERAAELVVEEYDEEFRAALRQGATDGVGAGRRMASRRFDLDVQFDVVPDRAIDAVEGVVADHAADSLQEMGRLFRSDIEDWLEDGLSTGEIAEQMQTGQYGDLLSDRHTRMHARTLVHGSAQRGAHTALEDAETVIGERWVSMADTRVRDTHEIANGQIAPVDGEFRVGGTRLDHPGDPTAGIGEIANCRCQAVPVFEEELTDEQIAQLRAGNIITT